MHSCLGLEVKTKPGKRRFTELKKEWKKKDILIIDEVSMVSLKTLYEIEHHCKVLKEDESPFGGIRVVLLCGGFYQMPPVQGHALYWNPNNNGRTKTCGDDNDNAVIDPRQTLEMQGKRLWEMFTTVVLLTEQM